MKRTRRNYLAGPLAPPRQRFIELLEVNRSENWAYLAVHSPNWPDEDPLDDCYNNSVPLDKLEKSCGCRFEEGSRSKYLSLFVEESVLFSESGPMVTPD